MAKLELPYGGREAPPRKTPEQFVRLLAEKLSHHAFSDALLLFLPPLAAVLYCLFYLFDESWISRTTLIGAGLAALAFAGLAILFWWRPKIPSLRSAARLIDQRADAQDRFLTLATLPVSTGPSSFVDHLRKEAFGLQARVALDREFPYRVKRYVYFSLLLSLALALGFPHLLSVAHSTLNPQGAPDVLRGLARQMEERPGLREAARSLRDLAVKLEDPLTLPQEKKRLLQQEQEKIKKQEKTEKQDGNREMLGRTSATLKNLEEETGAGTDQKNQEKGGGGSVQSDLPQQGRGEGGEGQGGGDSQGGMDAQLNNSMQQGKIAEQDVKDPSKDKKEAAAKGGGADGQPDLNQSGRDRPQERPGKTEGGRDDKSGRNKASEEIPQGGPPERYYKPGEGPDQGIKGAGYVTVQLPEEVAAAGKGGGEQRQSKSGKASSSALPVSNAPLPTRVPEAPSEKQPMPLEYRDIIR